MHQDELVGSFDENKKNAGREIGTGHAAGLQRHIVDVWTETGIWVAPDQQSLETKWDDNKDNLNTWMGDRVTK